MKYEITEEQIKIIYEATSINNQEELEDWFPDVFENRNGWYKDNCLFNKHWLGFYKDNVLIYGIGANKQWFESSTTTNSSTERKATDSEVLEALTNEAKKRGFKDGARFISPKEKCKGICGNYNYHNYTNILFSGGVAIFNKGVWGELYYTKEEAEKMLNAKIV